METTVVNSVDIKWIEKSEKKCLQLAIHGYLSEKIALEVTSKWKEEIMLNLKTDDKAVIVCNCLKMTGYDSNARKIWQQTISDLKSQIGYLWIITDNKLFRTAAMTMGLLTKFKIRTASSESEICIE
jgi:hypothetical protein